MALSYPYSNKKMKFRKAIGEDINAIMNIFSQARSYMKQNGNPNQWTNGYPEQTLIEEEIKSGHCIVVLSEEKEIVGTFCFIIGADPTYEIIEDGAWLNDKAYGVIHRIAKSENCPKGFSKLVFDWCFEHISSIRIDTHMDNLTMQTALKKYGFVRTGIIYLQDGSARIAFQLSV